MPPISNANCSPLLIARAPTIRPPCTWWRAACTRNGDVLLADEFDLQKLYLDIEKMRFEDRLRPHFRIEAQTIGARLPSLLLQPP